MIDDLIEVLIVPIYWTGIAAWRALPLFLVVSLLSYCLRKRLAPRVQVFLWMLVCLRFLLPVSLASPLSLHGFMDQWTASLMTDQQRDVPMDMKIQEVPYAIPEEEVAWQHDPLPETEFRPQPQTAPVVETLHWEEILLLVAFMLWAIVAMGMIVRAVGSQLWFAWRLRSCRELSDSTVLDLALKESDEIGVRRPRLKEVPFLKSPAVFGWWRPTICLPPSSVAELSPTELRWIIRHELAHIRHHDVFILSIAHLMRAVHWYNPFAWITVSQLANSMEQASDAIALRDSSDASIAEYGRLLLRCAEKYNRCPPNGALGLLCMAKNKGLRRRIDRLVAEPTGFFTWANCLAMAGLLLLGLSGLTDAQVKSPEKNSPRFEDQAWLKNSPIITTDPDFYPLGEQSPKDSKLYVYDVRKLIEKIKEQDPDTDVELLLKSIVGHNGTRTVEIKDGKLFAWLSPAAYQSVTRMLKAMESTGLYQITIELHMINSRFPADQDFDWFATSTLTSPSNSAKGDWESSTEENSIKVQDFSISTRPGTAAKLTEQQVKQFIQRVQGDTRDSIYFAPKVTLFNGLEAIVMDEVQRPFVVDVKKEEGNLRPVIKIFSEGRRFKLQAEVTEQEEVKLQCALIETDIVEEVYTVALPYRTSGLTNSSVRVQLPIVSNSQVQLGTTLKAKESLLIAIPQKYKESDSDNAERVFYYLLTPHILKEMNQR
ncbi:Hypothetical protein PBC10988_6530 [Planctomycetales bacterium 10988]|nr:Hypothetical protein PBC10988_6530 [Planctomycetales bacterium 10988]